MADSLTRRPSILLIASLGHYGFLVSCRWLEVDLDGFCSRLRSLVELLIDAAPAHCCEDADDADDYDVDLVSAGLRLMDQVLSQNE